MDMREKRLIEALTQYEAGDSLATLKIIFPDVAVDLVQIVEAQQMLKKGGELMYPSVALGKNIVASLSNKQSKNSLLFASSWWRLAAPVGIAAFSLMIVFLSGYQDVVNLSVISGGDAIVSEGEVALMMARQAETSLMAVSESEQEVFAMKKEEIIAPIDSPHERTSESFLIWKIISLGLLVIFSLVILFKHWRARRR